ncbi:unnamed protein product [Prunus armeniaca]
MPSTSRRLFVLSPEERHQEYQVYSDVRIDLMIATRNSGHPQSRSKRNSTVGMWMHLDRNLPYAEGTMRLVQKKWTNQTMFRFHPEPQTHTIRQGHDLLDKSSLAPGLIERMIGRREALAKPLTEPQVEKCKDIVPANQLVPRHQNPSATTSPLPILLSASSSRRSTGLRKNRTKIGHQLEERYNWDCSLAESESSNMTKKSKHSEYHFTQEWKIL